MARDGVVYRCRACDYQTPQWLGRCPQCGEWETLAALAKDGAAEAPEPSAKPQSLARIPPESAARCPSGLSEFDRVLGGGALAGSTVLMGGEPGVGKSTLMLQAAGELATRADRPWLYVSGEEAPAQIKLRASRLGIGDVDRLWVLGEQRLGAVTEAAREADAAGLVVDSIQTIFSGAVKDGPGSPHHVGEVAFELNRLAKGLGVPVFLIGHVTKEGEFAGPKAIEHLVDVALYLEGGRDGEVRILRAVKNRYGSTDEIGVFQMAEVGLREISDPSRFFTERAGEVKPGSVIVPSLEGSRPILVEIQSLVTGSRAAMPQRRTTGLDANRVAMLLAVVEKRLGLQIDRDDVYLNVAGGLSVRETAVDLGVAAAVASSYKNRAIDANTIVVGELGLSGELRRVRKLKERLSEAAKLGFQTAVVPEGTARVDDVELDVITATGLEEAIGYLGL